GGGPGLRHATAPRPGHPPGQRASARPDGGAARGGTRTRSGRRRGGGHRGPPAHAGRGVPAPDRPLCEGSGRGCEAGRGGDGMTTMAGPAVRARWAVTDAVTMTRRYLAHVVRAPEEIVLYFSLPVMFVLVFGYVFGSGMQVPDGGSYREFLLPGVFAMTMLYGLGATATAVA